MVMGLLVLFIIGIVLFYFGVKTLRNPEKSMTRGVLWMIASVIFFAFSFGPTIGGHVNANCKAQTHYANAR